MKSLVIALSFLLLFLPPVLSQGNPHKAEYQRLRKLGKYAESWSYLQEAYPQFDLKKILGLSLFVSGKEEDDNPLAGIQRPFPWRYQRKILEAARVDVSRDDEARIGEKVRKMWKVAEELGMTACSNTKFDVTNGNIIKFAVNVKFDEFLIDMTRWGVNLNMVDEWDGKTVLDYTQDQLKANSGLASERVLKRYYDMLQEAGAKHTGELR